MGEEEQVRALLYRFEESGLIARDIEQVISCLAKCFIGIGLGEQGFVTCAEDVRQVLSAGIKEEDHSTRTLEYNRVEVLIPTDGFAVLSAEITVHSQSAGQTGISRSKLLQSIAAIREDGHWKICQLHASTPEVTEETMEAYPLKFAEKTLQSLKEKIGEEVYQAEEQYRQAILSDTIAFYMVDFDRNIFEKCQLNSDWCVYAESGVQYDEYMTTHINEYIYPDDVEFFLQRFCRNNVLCAFQHGEKELSYEYRMKLPDGSYGWVVTIIRPIRDMASGTQKGIMYVKNIDRSKREELLMWNRATFDGLTGVYQRGAMVSRTSDRLSLSGGILVMLDVDDFKHINDTYGHPVGDEVLIAVAQEIKNCFESDVLVGRMGGDEFAFFLPEEEFGENPQAGLGVLLQRVSELIIREHSDLQVTCSAGATRCTKGVSFSELYERTDRALYQSKKSGKNRISFDLNE